MPQSLIFDCTVYFCGLLAGWETLTTDPVFVFLFLKDRIQREHGVHSLLQLFIFSASEEFMKVVF